LTNFPEKEFIDKEINNCVDIYCSIIYNTKAGNYLQVLQKERKQFKSAWAIKVRLYFKTTQLIKRAGREAQVIE
jgi:hypothetical protein